MTHGSLFSGVGGFDLAAEWMGWENLFHCEINEWCQKVLRFHFPKSIQYDDITKTDFSCWRGEIDILTGGFPCQPFSVAGSRKGKDDDRYLWPEMLRAIREIRPTWVIGENVAGILSMVQPGSEVTVESQASLFDKADKETILEQEYVIETVCRDLEREGYSVQPILIPACGVGAPHKRYRVWFIASDRSDARIEGLRQNGKTRFMDVSLLPTPTAQDFKRRGPNSKQQGLPEAAYKKMLPTPTARSYKNGSKITDGRSRRKISQGWTMELNDLAVSGLLPTPTMRDYQPSVSPTGLVRKNGKRRDDALCNIPVMIGQHCQQNDGKTSQLNPLFVEE